MLKGRRSLTVPWQRDRQVHDAPARVMEVAAHGRAPLRVAITNQHPVVAERLVVGEDERAGHPLYEQGVGIRRGADHLPATTRQIEDEEDEEVTRSVAVR